MKGMSEDKGWIKYVLDYTRSWYSRMRSNCRLISREKPGRKFVPGKKYFSWRIILEQILHLCMSGEKFYHRRFGKKFSPKPNHFPPPLPSAKVKWSAPYRLHYFASFQPPRSFRATFLDPFSPPSSLSLSLELARLTGCKSRMDVLLLVCYRCYDHDKLQIMACFISGWLGILILCFGFDYYRQRGNLAS